MNVWKQISSEHQSKIVSMFRLISFTLLANEMLVHFIQRIITVCCILLMSFKFPRKWDENYLSIEGWGTCWRKRQQLQSSTRRHHRHPHLPEVLSWNSNLSSSRAFPSKELYCRCTCPSAPIIQDMGMVPWLPLSGKMKDSTSPRQGKIDLKCFSVTQNKINFFSLRKFSKLLQDVHFF